MNTPGCLFQLYEHSTKHNSLSICGMGMHKYMYEVPLYGPTSTNNNIVPEAQTQLFIISILIKFNILQIQLKH